eukprot:scaffold6107_cov130-Isochrysis_galbana.AAC.4
MGRSRHCTHTCAPHRADPPSRRTRPRQDWPARPGRGSMAGWPWGNPAWQSPAGIPSPPARSWPGILATAVPTGQSSRPSASTSA